MNLAPPPNQRTTPGFLYLSYGMDEMPAGQSQERKQRFMMPPGAQWRVRLIARDGFFRAPGSKPADHPIRLSAKLLLQQVQAALWLLCHYGGVGSKGRNGFGSLAQLGVSDDESQRAELERSAAEFRRACGAREHEDPRPEIPALRHALPVLCLPAPWKNYWFVLDQLGYSIQGFAQKKKRQWIKEALGLPRKIGTSDEDGSRDRHYERAWDQQTRQQVVWLGQAHPYPGKREPKDMRHSAPVHFHVSQNPDGNYQIHVLAFPCAVLPDWDTSKKVLTELREHLEADFAQRRKQHTT